MTDYDPLPRILAEQNGRLIELRAAVRRLLDALDKEAATSMTLVVAQNNYSDFETERQISVRAMVEASEATKALRKLVEGAP
jgi:hypothetical protein